VLCGLLRRAPLAVDILAGLCGLVAIVACIIGITQLPPGAAPEIGLWLMFGSSLAIIAGLLVERVLYRSSQ
jgi:hypothetical protein